MIKAALRRSTEAGAAQGAGKHPEAILERP